MSLEHRIELSLMQVVMIGKGSRGASAEVRKGREDVQRALGMSGHRLPKDMTYNQL